MKLNLVSTKKEEHYRKKIQDLIEYCLYCQPYDEGDAVWIFGDRIDLVDLFYKCNVPENYWDNIMKQLYCPNCGLQGFSIGIDVGTKTKIEEEIDKHMVEVYGLYGTEVREFEALIEEYPFLALQHKFGKQIYKELVKKQLPIVKATGKFYRARKVTLPDVFIKDKMYKPPKGKPLEGRFNHAGQSHLYIASKKIAAIKEVVVCEKSLLVWCQEFKIENEIDNILDLSFDWTNLTSSTSALLLSLKVFNSIGRIDRNTENWRPDYYLTQFIMDCAKQANYNGIKYNSTKEISDYNLVLFYPKNLNIKAIGEPSIEIFMNKEEKENFKGDLLDF